MEWNKEKREFKQWTEQETELHYSYELLKYNNKKRMLSNTLVSALYQAIAMYAELTHDGMLNGREHGGLPLSEKMIMSLVKNDLLKIQECVKSINAALVKSEIQPKAEDFLRGII